MTIILKIFDAINCIREKYKENFDVSSKAFHREVVSK
jgi:hypothetical protein